MENSEEPQASVEVKEEAIVEDVSPSPPATEGASAAAVEQDTPSKSPELKENGHGAAKQSAGAATGHEAFLPLVMVVGFHHARGPEVESWFGAEPDSDPAVDNEWPLLPFMALSDGAHASTEDFSYFTLLRPARSSPQVQPATSVFGISCTRQMDSSALLNRPADVTRSTVQKAVVVIMDSPQHFGMLRERLSIVTQAWFAQKEFTDVEILRRFQESLEGEKLREIQEREADGHASGNGLASPRAPGTGGMGDEYLGMSLRELVREFRWQTLVLFKCCLLQPKMLFFGSRCERLCMMQFSLISLIPGLIRNLQDCADPDLDNYERQLVKPTSLKTSDRNSLLSYMGLPLQIFGKGSLFGPYTPLQQLDILADYGTKSYIVGSTNSLLLQQKDRYSDILINLDDGTINITSASLRSALALSVADRRWIDFITQSVNDTWDDANPGRPKTMGYVGSEEFIRLQFEEYLLSLISSVKCHNYIAHHAHNPRIQLPTVEGDPASDFGADWIEYWKRSENYRIWDGHTDSHLFDIVEPKHPCAGGLTIDDVKQRMMEQVKEFHLDERFAVGKEVVGRGLREGKARAGEVFGKLYADMEAFRERERMKREMERMNSLNGSMGDKSPVFGGNVDLNGAKQTVQSVSSKAGAYIGSWGTWMGEKRKTGWGRTFSSQQTSPNTTLQQQQQKKEKENIHLTTPTPFTLRPAPRGDRDEKQVGLGVTMEPQSQDRPQTKESFKEEIFDADTPSESALHPVPAGSAAEEKKLEANT